MTQKFNVRKRLRYEFKQENLPDNLVPLRFKTPYNSQPTKGEENNLPSMTVPDQTMSVAEILRRFGSGLPLGGQRVEFYEGDDDMWEGVDPRTLDISEREQIIQERVNELAELQSKQKNLSKKKAKEAQKELEDKIREQMQKQTGEPQDEPEP